MNLQITFLILATLGILAALATSFYNVFAVKWGWASGEERFNYSKTWHFYSWALRLVIGSIILFAGVNSTLSNNHFLFICLIYTNFAFTGYNLIYNKFFKHSWFYTGSESTHSGSRIDRLLSKWVVVAEALLLLLTILWYPLNLISVAETIYLQMVTQWLSFSITAVIITAAIITARKFYNK